MEKPPQNPRNKGSGRLPADPERTPPSRQRRGFLQGVPSCCGQAAPLWGVCRIQPVQRGVSGAGRQVARTYPQEALPEAVERARPLDAPASAGWRQSRLSQWGPRSGFWCSGVKPRFTGNTVLLLLKMGLTPLCSLARVCHEMPR